jgi:nitroreductase
MNESAPTAPMTLLEAIHGRRAVRAYAPTRVDEATIRLLLDAAVQAPSAMNAQPWAFAVVQDVARLVRYSDRAKAMLLERAAADPKASRYRDLLASEGFNIFYDAGTLIVIGVERAGPYTDADCRSQAAPGERPALPASAAADEPQFTTTSIAAALPGSKLWATSKGSMGWG